MGKKAKVLTTAALFLGGVAVLSGCSAIDDIVHKYSTSTFEDRSALQDADAVDAEWVPEDASEITVRKSSLEDAPDAVILLASTAEALGASCTEVPRTSGAAWIPDGAPSPYEAETVHVCGEWSVIPADGGWFGWTPNSREEREAALSTADSD